MADGIGKAIPFQRIPQPEQKSVEQKVRDVSSMYEKHFLREMVKAMRSTVHDGGLIKVNQAEKIFREQLDDEYVGKWSAQGGIGLSNLIYDQIVEKYGAMMGIKAPIQKPHGPIPLDRKSEISGRTFQPENKAKVRELQMEMNVAALQIGNPTPVKSPWSGTLIDKKALSLDEHLLEVQHDNGLKSKLTFRGTTEKLGVGSKLQAGENLGLLSPDAKSLFWNLQGQGPDEKTVSE